MNKKISKEAIPIIMREKCDHPHLSIKEIVDKLNLWMISEEEVDDIIKRKVDEWFKNENNKKTTEQTP